MRRRILTEVEVTENIRQLLCDDNNSDSDGGGEALPIDDDDGDESADNQLDDNDHVEEEIVPPVRQRQPKKKLTANRLVNPIDAALCSDNYDPFVLPDNNFETITGYLGPKSKDTTQRYFGQMSRTLLLVDKDYVMQLLVMFHQFAETQNALIQYGMHLSYL